MTPTDVYERFPNFGSFQGMTVSVQSRFKIRTPPLTQSVTPLYYANWYFIYPYTDNKSPLPIVY